MAATAEVAGNGRLHVLIIGAGVTGLLLAQALKKDGIGYSIFDAEDVATRTRTKEWGMSIHWSRPFLETLLPEDLLERLPEAQVAPSLSFGSARAEGYTVPFYNGKTGDHIVELPMKNNVRVSRRRFRNLCSEGIDIKVGEKLVSISHSSTGEITATFASGLTATGSIVIGTDGPHSAVRHILLGAEKAQAKQLEVIMYNMYVCYGDAERALKISSLHPVNTVAIQPDKGLSVWISIQEIPDLEKPETWSFQVMPTWKADGKEHHGGAQGLAELKEMAESLVDPWKSSLLWIPDGTDVAPNKVAYWITSPWDNVKGTVTLAGDAAHPLPPHRGQGLNHCIADVANFVKAIKAIESGTTTQEAAISAYDAELVKRGGDEVEMSRKNALLVHDYESFMESPLLKIGYTKGKGVDV